MLKSFYGCCPLRNGVGIIAIFNFIWNAYSIIYRSFQYIIIITSYNNRDFETFYNDTETIDNDPVETSTEKSDIWANSNIFTDYAFLVLIGWIFLELVVNVDLKKSTFAHAPHKIYAWLMVYGANATFMLVIFTDNVLRADSWITEVPIGSILQTSIITLELLAVYSYYRQEMKTSASNFVQLKWQYISKGRVLSKGTDYATASTFAAEISDKSRKTMPYVINIQQ
ncbi:uncharacterized protein LOC126840564 isoform X2 [Adelges cooleyi]|uniref:uncharacterized protein LOC126840564 isoform X2 n=1 Tax=Adelges cooleyi TaxID=133065 RepID=UPI0021807638|nr:uncharacterized protein LOC126840564 isoform X2 [Adelges cooleyi]